MTLNETKALSTREVGEKQNKWVKINNLSYFNYHQSFLAVENKLRILKRNSAGEKKK